MILSIVIPTFNRAQHLETLVGDLLKAVKISKLDAEVVVIDNASTDSTEVVLKKYSDAYSDLLKIKRQSANLGMEANISHAMLAGKGKYTWLISDHQFVDANALIDFLHKLPSLDFDYGYARIGQWQSIINTHTRKRWVELSPRERGAFLFTLGNISALIYRSSLASESAALIFKCCYFGYPHLAIFSLLNNDSKFFQTETLTLLPGSNKSIEYSYEIISTRYSKNYECLKFLLENKSDWLDKNFFCTADYCRAFRADVLNLLLSDKNASNEALKSLKRIFPSNRGINLFIALSTFLAIKLLPGRFRIAMAKRLKIGFKNLILQ